MNAIDVLTAGKPAVEYPESDGKPMAETGIHVDRMTDLYKMLRVEGGQLRLYDRATGQRVRTPLEEMEGRQAAEARLEQEFAARQAAEAELERLRAELERLRGR